MDNFKDMLAKAGEMQAKMNKAQEEIAQTEAEGVAGAGMVKVVLRGKGELVSVQIDPSLMGDEAEIVEDLIKAAHNEARKNLEQAMAKAMESATSGFADMLPPGMKMGF